MFGVFGFLEGSLPCRVLCFEWVLVCAWEFHGVCAVCVGSLALTDFGCGLRLALSWEGRERVVLASEVLTLRWLACEAPDSLQVPLLMQPLPFSL